MRLCPSSLLIIFGKKVSMNDKERISQLEELTSEALRKLDVLTGDVSTIKADVSALRTAQLRTMQIVAGNTEAIGLIIDRLDRHEEKLSRQEEKIDRQSETLDRQGEKIDIQGKKLDSFDKRFDRLEAFTTKQEEFNTKIVQTLEAILNRLDQK